MTRETVNLANLANLVGLVSFFGILGFRGVSISKVKHPGKCHDIQRKCKMEWVGLFGLRVNNKGRHFVGVGGHNFKNMGNITIGRERKLKKMLVCE